ncbi:MAG: PorV/PorQ family protein [Calditrichaeota bacterium]|nr:PorV/PorQ family protein [Calditrichota bacterium]
MEQSAAGMFSTVNIFSDIRVNYLAVGAGMGKFGHIGFSIKAFDFGDIPLTTVEDMDGSNGRTFSPTFSTIALTYSNKLTSTINVGLTTKLIYESAPRVNGSAVAFDIGLQYKNLAGIEGVSFAVVAKNIGSNLQYKGTGLMRMVTVEGRQEFLRRGATSDQLPASLELGLSYNYKVMEDNTLILSGVFRNNNVQNDGIPLRYGIQLQKFPDAARRLSVHR